MWWGDGFGWGWMLFGGLMMLIFWGGLIALTVVVIRALSGSGSRPQANTGAPPAVSNSALDILKERYARGAITKVQYEEMRRDIMS